VCVCVLAVSFLPKSVPIHAKCSGDRTDGWASARAWASDGDGKIVQRRRHEMCGRAAARRVSRRAETYVGHAFPNGPRFRPIRLNCCCFTRRPDGRAERTTSPHNKHRRHSVKQILGLPSARQVTVGCRTNRGGRLPAATTTIEQLNS